MSKSSKNNSNVLNRSPWLVQVRSQPELDRKFSFPSYAKAAAYLSEVLAKGMRAKLVQLETSFQLRLRRKGIKDQFITFDSLAEAEQARLKMESDLSVGIIRDYSCATQTTLRDLMQRYLEEVVPSHKGREVESNRLRRIMRDEAFVDKKLAALVTEDLQDFITDRLTEVAPATVDRDLDLISQVIRYASDVWKIAAVESPFVGLRRPKYFNERDRRITQDEENRLHDAASVDENPYILAAIVLALETAARRGELLSMTKEDVDLKERYVFLKDTKNGRSRKVPLSKRAMAVIIKLMDDCVADEEHLLKITANALKIGFFRRVVPAAGVEDLHFHDLRHEAISRLAESGQFQLIELQAVSGHRDMRMLQRYAHLCSGLLAEKMDAVAAERTTREYLHRGRRRRVEECTPLQLSGAQIPVKAKVERIAGNVALPSNVVSFSAAKRNKYPNA